MKLDRFFGQFNWRFLLVRIVVNALALASTAAVLPKIYFVDKSVWNWLLMALMLGVLNALLKPVLQFLTLQFIFVTYGLVIVAVNSLLLWLLSFLFPNRFAVDSILWLLVGGLVLGLVSSFLESLFGLTIPIVPDEPPTLRHQIEDQAHQTDWLAAASSGAIPEALTQAADRAAWEASMTEATVEGSPVVDSDVTEPAAVEPAAARPNEQPSLRTAPEAELSASTTPADSEAEPRSHQEEEEGRP
jgi:putative membrane protein